MAKKYNSRFMHYMGDVVRVLRELGHSARAKQVVEAIESSVDIPTEDLERKTKSGQSIFENDVHWCRAYLAKAGFIDSSKRGVWTLTAKGRTADVNDELITSIVRNAQNESRKATDKAEPIDPSPSELDSVETEIEEIYRAEVLSILQRLTPSGFEHFCQELLYVAGFEDVRVTGRTGDRGIDGHGILQINPLFSMKVAFQAKRYVDKVGSGVIRDFRGSVIGRADRGLLITTGMFTRDAEAESSRYGATHIELIDGHAIVDLMEEYEFGLKPVSTFEVDDDFFEKFESED